MSADQPCSEDSPVSTSKITTIGPALSRTFALYGPLADIDFETERVNHTWKIRNELHGIDNTFTYEPLRDMEALFQGLGISCDYTEDSPEIEDNSSDVDDSLVEPARSNPVRPGGAVRVQNLQDIWTEREKVKEQE